MVEYYREVKKEYGLLENRKNAKMGKVENDKEW